MSAAERLGDACFTGLRLVEGIDLDELSGAFWPGCLAAIRGRAGTCHRRGFAAQ